MDQSMKKIALEPQDSQTTEKMGDIIREQDSCVLNSKRFVKECG
jgi:hypothetical protein